MYGNKAFTRQSSRMKVFFRFYASCVKINELLDVIVICKRTQRFYQQKTDICKNVLG